MFTKKSALLLLPTICVALFASTAAAGKAKPTFYCDKSAGQICGFGSSATVNAKKSRISRITIKGPACIRTNGTKVEDFTPTIQKENVKLTGRKKNRFSIKGDITLQDDVRDGPYSFPYKATGTVKHKKSIQAKVTVTGAVSPCANITEFTVTLRKR